MVDTPADLGESEIKWVRNAIDSNYFIRKEFLDEQGWIAIPVESACHFDEEDAKRISSVAGGINVDTLNAVSIEDFTASNHIEIGFNADDIQKFSLDFGHFNYALFPSNHSFLLVCTTDDYFAVAGGTTVVERLAGNSVREARIAFSQFATDENWPSDVKSFLTEVFDWYRDK